VKFSIFTDIDSLVYKGIIGSLSGSSYIGNPKTAKPDTSFLYTLPGRKGYSFRILQGQDGSFTHNTDINRYAIDIAMPVGDTVYAAREGTVAYTFAESSYGGNNEAYLDYANTIMIYHEDGTVAQYSHLKQNGVLVEIGTMVQVGEPIGLSGNTGFVSGDHLHLNVFEPLDKGTRSVFISFKGYEGKWFDKGDRVSH
jgi:murein DD-endopeptidase MepM/ murein hydrolase activator NlpD